MSWLKVAFIRDQQAQYNKVRPASPSSLPHLKVHLGFEEVELCNLAILDVFVRVRQATGALRETRQACKQACKQACDSVQASHTLQ